MRTANVPRTRVVRRKALPVVLAFLLSSFLPVCVNGQSALPASSSPDSSGVAQLSDGTISGNTYQNSELGLRYEFPAHWVANDKATQQRAVADSHQYVWADDTAWKRDRKAERQCAKSLLYVTQYPEEMRVNEFNPLVFMIAADPKCAPGVTFPISVKDQQGIKQIASHAETYFKTFNISSSNASQVHAYEFSGRVIIEVSKVLRAYSHEPGVDTLQEIHTSIFLAPTNKYWVMWMFAGADDGQLARLRATKIFFDGPAGAADRK